MRSPECKASAHRDCAGEANRGTTDRPRMDACSCGCHHKPKAARSPISGTVRRWVRDRDGGRCVARIEGVCSGRGEHLHHIRQRSLGGDEEMGNLLLCCHECHRHLHETMPLAEAKARGLLR